MALIAPPEWAPQPPPVLPPSSFSGHTGLRTCRVLTHLCYQKPLPLALHTTSYPFLTSQPKFTLSEVKVFLFLLSIYNEAYFVCGLSPPPEYRYPRGKDLFCTYLTCSRHPLNESLLSQQVKSVLFKTLQGLPSTY